MPRRLCADEMLGYLAARRRATATELRTAMLTAGFGRSTIERTMGAIVDRGQASVVEERDAYMAHHTRRFEYIEAPAAEPAPRQHNPCERAVLDYLTRRPRATSSELCAALTACPTRQSGGYSISTIKRATQDLVREGVLAIEIEPETPGPWKRSGFPVRRYRLATPLMS